MTLGATWLLALGNTWLLTMGNTWLLTVGTTWLLTVDITWLLTLGSRQLLTLGNRFLFTLSAGSFYLAISYLQDCFLIPQGFFVRMMHSVEPRSSVPRWVFIRSCLSVVNYSTCIKFSVCTGTYTSTCMRHLYIYTAQLV